MLKVALIGCGGISRAHFSSWSRIPEVELVGACDIRPEKADEAAQKYNCKAYYSFDEMMAEISPDILDICLPTYLHADYAVKGLEKGMHVLTEKPISLKKADVERVYSAAAKANRRFMVAQVLRFWPEYNLVADLFKSGKYGKFLAGSMSRLGNTPGWSWEDWMRDVNRSGLVPFDLHIHDLDFIIYLFGKPASVETKRALNGTQDYINVLYQYPEFFISTEAAWYNGKYPFHSSFRFQFEHAVVEYEHGKCSIYEENGNIENVDFTDKSQGNGINLPGTDAYFNEIRYFTDCVLADKDCEMVKAEQLEIVLDIIDKNLR